MHALFTQIAPVRFDVLLRSGQDLPAPDTITAATAADVVEPYNVIQPAEPQPQRERSNTVTSDDNSDDGSLIEFEEAQETATLTESALDQPIAYPQEDLHEATLRQEQEMIEAQKLQAPLIPASVTSHETTMDLEETNNDETTNRPSSRRSSKSSSPAMVPVAEFEALRMDSAAEVMDSIVASAIEQHAQDVAAAVQANSDSEDGNNAHGDPVEPEITEPAVPHGDRALIEQFQMLIQEFQHVIQNNPQLVTISGSIMNKIMSNVQVNVESFANYLQEAARNAQASAEEAAAGAHEAAAEATRSCPFGGSGSDNPFLSNPFFAHHHRGRFGGRRGHEDPFSGCHDNETGDFSDHSHHHGHHHGHHHRGGRGGFGGFGGRGGGRGGCSGRGAGHQWSFGSLFPTMPHMPHMPPMPAMPHMPPMPPMPPMPGMPAMPPMPPMPGMPGMFPSEGTSVPNTKPSPFSGGFPFHFGAPGSCKRGNNFRFRGDRPTACDTESSEKKRRSCSENKGKNASSSSSDEATATTQKQQGESSSSAQHQPQMTEIGNGWTWTLLPDETTDAADPNAEPSSSSRPKYGWVWSGGENGDTENPEPAPIYVESDEEMAEPTQDGPQGPFDFGRHGGRGGRGRGGFAFFRGRGGSRGGSRGGHPFAFHPHGPHGHGPHGPHGHGPHIHHGPEHHGHAHVHHHNNEHHHRHHRRHSGSKSGEEGHAESGSDEKLRRRQTFHEQRQARVDQRQVQEEQRKAQEEQRKVQVEQRKVQEEQRRVQEQQRREGRAPATTAAPIGGGSLAGIWPNTPPVPATPATPTASSTPSTPATPAAPLDLGATNDDFRNEIRMLTNMGFADTPELRTVVRDFGGEVEAVVEFMISAGRQ